MMGSAQTPRRGAGILFLMILTAPREVHGTQMVLNKYLLSGAIPDTAKAKKTLTQESHISQNANFKKEQLQSN